MIKLFEYPADCVPTWETELVNEVDSLWWDETDNFFYSYRGGEPTPYKREKARIDARYYYETKQLRLNNVAICKKAGLI